ncbi:glycerate kinase [Metabacillus fastidiosus]|uniref:glycerate kinase n=1 Tax=Metabacillus fastidiosus TaxID=1458 RepID=UPI00082533A5|nr:glycerate kinase [Metabacillus fastidiosus]MED4460934.1 glycerate kinase [Metabacillus fastidiosus]
MKIIIAPDSFKESLTALDAANAIEEGFKKIFPKAIYVKIPMADGGEGTVQSLVDATDGQIIEKTVTGPLGTSVSAFFGLLGDKKTAVIEMAAASGLHHVPLEKRNPLITTTFGTGELILAALDYEIEHIIIGIGGSATNDGGAGMIQALGGKLLNKNGEQIGFGGEQLQQLASVDFSMIDERLKKVTIEVACDVDNPLTGNKGAAAVFGPQKGATREIVNILDQNLAHYANIIEASLHKNFRDIPGAGAAGGLGFGLIAIFNAQLTRGVEIVLKAVQFEKYLTEAALVITGEGRIDSQTIHGKTPIGVAKTAKKYNLPVIAIAGSISTDSSIVREYGIDALFSIVPSAVSLENALENAYEYTVLTAENVAAFLKQFSM